MANKYKEISISGLSTSPSDLQADDGNLAIAGNSIHFDGTIRRFIHPTTLLSSSQYTGQESDGRYNITAVYQHANDNYQHIIYRFLRIDRGQQIISYGWSTFDDTSRIYEFADGRSPILGNIDIHSYASVGNTIIMYADDTTYYFIYKNGSYKFIGNHMPELEISFSLVPHIYYYRFDRTGQVGGDDNDYGKIKVDFEDAYKLFRNAPDTYNESYDVNCTKVTSDVSATNLSNTALGLANKFIGQWCNKYGYFSQPFLARAAFRMFDGSNVMVTSPVLMRPSTHANPLITIEASQKHSLWLNCIGIGCQLCYHILNDKDELDDWSDIIKGVDIFTSNPFYTYDQGGSIDSVVVPCLPYCQDASKIRSIFDNAAPAKLWDRYCIVQSGSETGDQPDGQWSVTRNNWKYSYNFPLSKVGAGYYQARQLYDVDGNLIAYFSEDDLYTYEFYPGAKVTHLFPTAYVLLPKFSESTMRDKIRDCANFYLIKSYKFGDITFGGNRTAINLDEGVINSLSNREQLQEDYRSHDVLIPDATFVYNNRLNATSIKRYPYAGYSPFSMFQRINSSQNKFKLSTVVYLRNSAGNLVFRREDLDSSRFTDILSVDGRCLLNYAYYPDSTAYQMDIIREEQGVSTIRVVSLPLTIHNGLNGSVFFDGLEANIQFSAIDYPNAEAYFDSLPERANGTYTIESSTVYTSDDSNPFVFRAANVEQVGNGQIIAMAPAVQALSAGQFGQYPMYCFTTEGIWALTVSDTGGWQSKQPISRDVALAASTILQTDQSVIFATARGLMQITGSTVTYISDIFDGQPDVFTRRCTTHLNEIFHQQSGLVAGMPSFRDYLQGCNMHYAYRNQRIYIGNPDYQHAFVFSMKDRLWTTVPLCITSAINSYPDALAMIDNLDQTTSLVNLIIDDPTAPNTTATDPAPIAPSPAASPAAILGRDAAASDTATATPPRAATTPICLLTRPINFDDPHGLKTLITTQVRGMFDPTHITLHLYATRDLVNWLEIARVIGPRISLRHGAPYRAFRLAIIADLTPDEYLTTITAEYEPKLYNKLR